MKKLFLPMLLTFVLISFNQVLKAQEDPNAPIFAVKNDQGQIVFAVYQGGVKIFINEEDLKATGGGFSVGRLSTGKSSTDPYNYFTVFPGDVRVNLPEERLIKASGGGFSVGRLSTGKSSGNDEDYLIVKPDSTKVYVRKTSNGGFGVGKIGSASSGASENFLDLTPDNYFIGHRSGQFSSGTQNLFLGYESGKWNTTGEANTFVGYRAGFANTTGNKNIYFGFESGKNNTNGMYNIFMGYQAGLRSKENSDYNIFIGANAAKDKTSGIGNVIVGKYAGENTGDGEFNVIIGSQAGFSSKYEPQSEDVLNDNVIIGNRAGYSGIGKKNVLIGAHAGYNLDPHTSMGNVFIGNQAGKNETGSNKLYISNSSTSEPLIWGDFVERKVQINGDLFATGEITSLSDIRLKTNIEHISSALETIKSLNGYYYDWNEDLILEKAFTNKRQIGVMAQEVEKVLPTIVDVTPKGYKSVNYLKLTPVIIEAIKEQNTKIEKLEEKIDNLTKENVLLKNKMKEIELMKSEIEELKALIKKDQTE